ncbi:MAG: DJ-1/PfpI family protein [Planctomycetota bacterium]
MKRLIILGVTLACFAALCMGQRRSRVTRGKIIQLTEPKLTGLVSFEEALARRRSVRQFASQPLSSSQISQLAWAGQGITEPQRGLRTAPSAGAIYPIELYFATQEGVSVYQPQGHSLKQTLDQDVRAALTAASTQGSVPGCDIIVAGSVKKLTAQFRRDARKYMLLEAGHIAQNIQLQAVCLGLGSVTVGGFDISGVRKVCRLPRDLEPLYVICVGYPLAQTTTETGQAQESTGAKRAVLIVASENFREDELIETKRVLDAAAVQTIIASTKIGFIRGMLGKVAEARILVSQLRVDDYDAIIFIGGPGATEYFKNPVALNIAREAAGKGKILAAICIAPTVLANAGVLTGVRATAFLSERRRLLQAGAVYTGVPVERDRFIITGSGPAASFQFGRVIADALAGR